MAIDSFRYICYTVFTRARSSKPNGKPLSWLSGINWIAQ